ncbi:MAG TPA: sensor domain-containing protein, partial [Streptosporangiaceae bacterium]|nr:sensor domain-containing protein [Streptosporangiaceae bacterium]
MFLLRDLVSARTWLAMTQHLAGLFLGFAAIFIVTFGLGFGLGGLFFALVGLPLLGVTLRLAHWFARAERARFAFLTGMRIPAWPAAGSAGRADYRWGIIPRWKMWTEGATWAQIGYALLRLPVSAAAVTLSIAAWAFGLTALALPAYAWSLPNGGPAL